MSAGWKTSLDGPKPRLALQHLPRRQAANGWKSPCHCRRRVRQFSYLLPPPPPTPPDAVASRGLFHESAATPLFHPNLRAAHRLTAVRPGPEEGQERAGKDQLLQGHPADLRAALPGLSSAGQGRRRLRDDGLQTA